jgi:hypothetical protein
MNHVIILVEDMLQGAMLGAGPAGLVGNDGRKDAQWVSEFVNPKPGHGPARLVSFKTIELKGIPAINDIDLVSQTGQVFTNRLRDDGVAAMVVRGVKSGDVTKPHAASHS